MQSIYHTMYGKDLLQLAFKKVQLQARFGNGYVGYANAWHCNQQRGFHCLGLSML